MKLSRYTLRTGFLVLALALSLLVLGGMPGATWDGAYALTIQPQSQSNRGVKRISYCSTPARDTAQSIIDQGSPEYFEQC